MIAMRAAELGIALQRLEVTARRGTSGIWSNDRVCLSFGADMGPDRAVGAPPESGAATVALYEWLGTDAEPYSSSVGDSRL